ncbi:hypothetical protein WMW72_15350 [Paenibacillus filicis]|uniref:Uncharacterized protein n=1 Tax=Paenibacillus filicis TaxID=669464 RepID=A0ABU9DKA2_9BACL
MTMTKVWELEDDERLSGAGYTEGWFKQACGQGQSGLSGQVKKVNQAVPILADDEVRHWERRELSHV